MATAREKDATTRRAPRQANQGLDSRDPVIPVQLSSNLILICNHNINLAHLTTTTQYDCKKNQEESRGAPKTWGMYCDECSSEDMW
jgi:hypothetical protein